MYKLYIIENKDSSDVWRQQEWGKGGEGYIVYDGKGHMGVHITSKVIKILSGCMKNRQLTTMKWIKK